MTQELLTEGTRKLIEAGVGDDSQHEYGDILQPDEGERVPAGKIGVAHGHNYHYQGPHEPMRQPDWEADDRSEGRKPVDKF